MDDVKYKNPLEFRTGGLADVNIKSTLQDKSTYFLWRQGKAGWEQTSTLAVVAKDALVSRITSFGWWAATAEFIPSTVKAFVVQNSTGVSNAYVQLIGESYQAITSNYTDASGQFEIVYKDQGTFNITIDYLGTQYRASKFYTGPELQNLTIDISKPF